MTRSIIPLPVAAVVRPAEDLASIFSSAQADHEASEDTARESLLRRLSAGQKLIQAKEQCYRENKNWLPSLRKYTTIKERLARLYMHFAKSATVADSTEQLEDKWNVTKKRHKDKEGDRNSESNSTSDTSNDDKNKDDEEKDLDEDENSDNMEDDEEEDEEEQNNDESGEDSQDQPSNTGKIGRAGDYVTLDKWNQLTERDRTKVITTLGDTKFNDQGDNTGIKWALWSWNPVTGCLHNCPYCYARDIANRFYEPKFTPTLWPKRLRAPRNTPFPAEKAKQWMGHKNVFVCSMADLFGRWVPTKWIEAVLEEVRAAKQWNFLFLTKFPIRMAEFDFPDNAWVGTTVDCQARVANAERSFRKVKAGVKWLSCEPLIEPLKFADIGAFDWIVIGGASHSTQTPEWRPPSHWVVDLMKVASNAGCKVYVKANTGPIECYPNWEDDREAPQELVYLPKVEKPI